MSMTASPRLVVGLFGNEYSDLYQINVFKPRRKRYLHKGALVGTVHENAGVHARRITQ